jgi:TRAP-type C4-dicarboxylate transport system permease small subunit
LPENKEVSFFSLQDAPWERRVAGTLRVLGYVGMAFVVAMMLLTVVHATGRYIFNKPVLGVVEMSSFMLIMVIFLTGAYTQVLKGHIRVGVVVDRLPERAQAIIDSLTYILSAGFVGIALWQAVVQGFHRMEEGYVSIILGIPPFPFLFVMAFGWGMLALALLMHLRYFLSKAVRGPRK